MTSTFLPEASTMPAQNGYRGLYRLFEDTDFRMVCDPRTRKAIIFTSAHEALKAAKDTIRRKLNPDLTSAAAGPVPEEEDPDIMQMQKWREEKQEAYAKSRAMVKNGKRHRQVVVEKKGRAGRGKIRMSEEA